MHDAVKDYTCNSINDPVHRIDRMPRERIKITSHPSGAGVIDAQAFKLGRKRAPLLIANYMIIETYYQYHAADLDS